MAFAKSATRLSRMLTTCCAATFTWSAATAQSPTLGEQVEFAGAEICRPGLIKVPAELKAASGGAGLPIHIEADSIETSADNTVILRGSAEVVQGARGVYAERIVYYRDTYRAAATGGVVFYTAGGDEIRAEALDLEVDTFVGKGSGVRIKLADDDPFGRADENYRVGDRRDDGQNDDKVYARARATARNVDFEGGDFQRLENVTMTTCAEGNDDVLLSAREIELDHAAGVGTAKSMTVKFKQIPIFYFPIATFPINDQRKTGFLFPSAGYDNESGVMAEAPYYINIAPQYDATVTPRVLSNRGEQLLGEFRYLGENGRGTLRGEFLPEDDAYKDADGKDADRYAFKYDHRHRFGDDWRATVDWQTISDSDYLRDFASAVASEVNVVASSYVAKKAELDYFGEALRFSARGLAYDSTNDAIRRADRPYQTVPQLQLEVRPRKLGFFRGEVEAQYSNFRHDDKDEVNGTRLRVKPSISVPLEKSYGYIVPKASLQTIRYSLDDNAPADDAPPANAPPADDTPAVDIPIYSIDGRLFFDRQITTGGGASYSQTLTPRLFYVNIPKKRGQNVFPDFDTSVGSNSSFAHFFRENRFFGGDRVGDTEQISVGVTSRITDNTTGRQRFKLSLGQIFYLKDREIGLPPAEPEPETETGTTPVPKTENAPSLPDEVTVAEPEPETENASGLLGEVTAAVSENWDVTGFARWDDRRDKLGAFRFSADYHRNKRRNASVDYTYNDAAAAPTSEQINLAFQTPLGPRWQLQGSGAYSLEEDEVQSSGIGLSYDGCCWAARVASQRYLDGEGKQKNRLVFTFELDDLGRIRSRL